MSKPEFDRFSSYLELYLDSAELRVAKDKAVTESGKANVTAQTRKNKYGHQMMSAEGMRKIMEAVDVEERGNNDKT
jgi:hypothetical protein